MHPRVGLVDHVVGCLQCIALEGSFGKGKGSFGKGKVLAAVAVVQGVSYWNVACR